MSHPLDNLIWNALTGVEKAKNAGTGIVAWLDEEISPFIGMPSWDEKHQRLLLETAPAGRNWFLLIRDEVKFLDELEIKFSIPLWQCWCRNTLTEPSHHTNAAIVPLHSIHVEEMIALTALTKPGPFAKRTIEYGNYHGIFEDGKLVAMGGERLHLDGLTEISAICTHPDYRGMGYGAQITHFLAKSVLEKGQTPYLHARVDNLSAMEVYKKLGFEVRAEIQFYIFRRKDI